MSTFVHPPKPTRAERRRQAREKPAGPPPGEIVIDGAHSLEAIVKYVMGVSVVLGTVTITDVEGNRNTVTGDWYRFDGGWDLMGRLIAEARQKAIGKANGS